MDAKVIEYRLMRNRIFYIIPQCVVICYLIPASRRHSLDKANCYVVFKTVNKRQRKFKEFVQIKEFDLEAGR